MGSSISIFISAAGVGSPRDCRRASAGGGGGRSSAGGGSGRSWIRSSSGVVLGSPWWDSTVEVDPPVLYPSDCLPVRAVADASDAFSVTKLPSQLFKTQTYLGVG
jgi:hypothetical protein